MPAFRVNRKKFGLTYSCPVSSDDNPIQSSETLKIFLDSFGVNEYLICEELHESGKKHYHAYVKYDDAIDSTKATVFDLLSVHPNIINPGNGWIKYVAKQGNFITNFYERNPFTVALAMDTPQEAIDHLWEIMPGDMCKNAHNIESNVRKRMRTMPPTISYFGPYDYLFYPLNWNPKTHSLLITGEPGLGKTQFAKYLLHHEFGGFNYVKGTLHALRDCDFSLPILFDEVNMGTYPPDASKEITDVEHGGTITARYSDIVIPPGVPRIFLSNYQMPFLDPTKAVYGRRVQRHSFPHPFGRDQSSDQNPDSDQN